MRKRSLVFAAGNETSVFRTERNTPDIVPKSRQKGPSPDELRKVPDGLQILPQREGPRALAGCGLAVGCCAHAVHADLVQDKDCHCKGDKGRQEARQEAAMGEACHAVAHKAAYCHDQGVGELRRDMLDVITAGTCTGKNGSVGNGRAVIAKDGSCQGGGKCHDQKLGIQGLGDRHHDGNEDTEGAPGSACGEAQEGCDQEDDGRQKARGETSASDSLFHEHRGGEKVAANTTDGPGKNQDDVCGQHGLHALDAAIQEGLHGDKAPGHKLDEGDCERAKACPHKALGGCAVAKGSRYGVVLGIIAPVAAVVEEAKTGKDNQGNDGHDHFGYGSLLGDFHLCLCGLAHIAEISLFGLGLGSCHGAKIYVQAADGKDHDDGEQGVEVVGNGRDKGRKIALEGACGSKGAANSCCPA